MTMTSPLDPRADLRPRGNDEETVSERVIDLITTMTAAVVRQDPPRVVSRRPGPHGAGPVDVPAVDEVLDRVRELWWQRLDPEDRLAVHVAALHRSPRPTPVSEVVAACRLAAACGRPVRLPEFTSMTLGSVKPGLRGTWSAEVGTRPYGIGHIGEYGSIRAANAAVWDTIETNRETLRDRMRAASPLLAGVAGRGWEEPQVSVWASAEQRDEDDAELVTMHQIAHRARVGVSLADRWRAEHAAFPAPETGTSLWYWPLVERWLADTGRLPADGPAADRPDLPRDSGY
ncbi:hypothetical protein [Actinoplanes sp. GCM10030250]|uniref:hypothetical protein n=1 Tax=Actinoplanes sp. GCM10030250 TaxID=3273376 RepID=UPI00361FDFBE